MQQEYLTDRGKVEVRWEPQEEQKPIYEKPEQKRTIRVAAYCRVSTELDEQTDSFELQERYYARLIQNTPGWRLIGIYADQGITGTQRTQRIGFQRMIRHCEEGKIDRILCKSISRFARNTMDLLDTVRILKEKNISVIFEKEGIDTLSVQSEFVLSTIAAIAQEESRSISENMLWSFKKRFQRGIPVFRRILGYNIERLGKNERRITINEEEASIVREIFDLALKGKGYLAIARMMMDKGYKMAEGRTEWTSDAVKGILINERYSGNVLCQKTYTPDYLTHKCKQNHGEQQQYFIENHHPGIISQDVFDAVQVFIRKGKRGRKKARMVYPLTGRVKCGECGANYHRYSSYNASWKCSRSIKSSKLCGSRRTNDGELERAIFKAFEIKYGLMNQNTLYKLRLEMKRFQEDDHVERSRVILKRELMVALDKELHSIGDEQTIALAKRRELEEKLERQEQYWGLLELDRDYRVQTLRWLEGLPHGMNGVKAFFDEVNTEYMRAWVMGITVSSPFLFTIKWFDSTETTVEDCGE